MGLHKRNISKNNIISRINENNIEGISTLFKADALIMDKWSNNFYKKFDMNYKEYQLNRQKIMDDTMYYSGFREIIEHENYDKLKSLSNVYLNLKMSPGWVDLLLAHELIKQEFIPESIKGRFSDLVKFYIRQIEFKYET